jgi:hypothetical protein
MYMYLRAVDGCASPLMCTFNASSFTAITIAAAAATAAATTAAAVTVLLLLLLSLLQ